MLDGIRTNGVAAAGPRDPHDTGPTAVILAGGKGTRLAPYTTVLPKPLMPIGDRAILEVVVEQLRRAGFPDLVFAVGHLGHLIRAVFQGGDEHGVSIRYHHEDRPLGTAGPLARMAELDEPFLMMNGDILTALDYGELYRFHRSSENILTIATHRRVVRQDYGVLELSHPGVAEAVMVTGYREKPEQTCSVSMGIYVAAPEVRDYIRGDETLDMPDLVLRLLADGRAVGAFVYDGFWLDIGRREDYERAITTYESVIGLLTGPRPAGAARVA